MNKFFFISGRGWDSLDIEEVLRDFLVWAIWGSVLDEKILWATMVPLSRWEMAGIEVVRSWAIVIP